MPPAYVKPYVRRNKTDAADAAAICEAVARPSMRFVPVKSAARQGVAGLHKVRTLAVKQRTMLVNQLRGLMAEFGLVAPRGSEGVARLLQLMRAARADGRLPAALGEALGAMSETLDNLERRIAAVDAALAEAVAADAEARRLCAIPGVGPLIASALVNAVDAPGAYRRARDFAAGLGLTPRQHGTGGVTRLGRISKRGDRYLRRLLVNGAMSVVLHRKAGEDPWLDRLRASKPRKLVAVALANKIARTAWAMMQRAESYRGVAAAA